MEYITSVPLGKSGHWKGLYFYFTLPGPTLQAGQPAGFPSSMFEPQIAQSFAAECCQAHP